MFSIILLSILSILLGMFIAFILFYFEKKKIKKQKELIKYHNNLINNFIKKTSLILIIFLSSCIDIKYENKEPIKIQIINKKIITAHSELTYHYGYSVIKGKFCFHYGEENIPTKYIINYIINNDTISENIDSLKYMQINIKDSIFLNIKYKYVDNKLTDTIYYLYE
jgi:phosphate/sulfate permease